MKLLILNPNTCPGVTARIRAAAAAAARPEDKFTTTCPDFGPALIVTEADADTAARGVLAKLHSYPDTYDGIVLASFGNTGAALVRGLRPNTPVVGIAQAAFAKVRRIGGPFGIVTFGAGLVPGLTEEVEAEGLAPHLLGISHLPQEDFGDAATVQFRFRQELTDLCVEMHQRGARAVVMGGGPLAGFAQSISDALPIPVIDGTESAIRLMRSLISPVQAHDA